MGHMIAMPMPIVRTLRETSPAPAGRGSLETGSTVQVSGYYHVHLILLFHDCFTTDQCQAIFQVVLVGVVDCSTWRVS